MEPVAGVSEVGRGLRPRWTLLCVWVIDFRTRRHRIEAGGGRRVRGGAAKEFEGHAPRRNASWEVCRLRGGPRGGLNVYPEPVGYYSSTVVCNTFFFSYLAGHRL